MCPLTLVPPSWWFFPPHWCFFPSWFFSLPLECKRVLCRRFLTSSSPFLTKSVHIFFITPFPSLHSFSLGPVLSLSYPPEAGHLDVDKDVPTEKEWREGKGVMKKMWTEFVRKGEDEVRNLRHKTLLHSRGREKNHEGKKHQ